MLLHARTSVAPIEYLLLIIKFALVVFCTVVVSIRSRASAAASSRSSRRRQHVVSSLRRTSNYQHCFLLPAIGVSSSRWLSEKWGGYCCCGGPCLRAQLRRKLAAAPTAALTAKQLAEKAAPPLRAHRIRLQRHSRRYALRGCITCLLCAFSRRTSRRAGAKT